MNLRTGEQVETGYAHVFSSPKGARCSRALPVVLKPKLVWRCQVRRPQGSYPEEKSGGERGGDSSPPLLRAPKERTRHSLSRARQADRLIYFRRFRVVHSSVSPHFRHVMECSMRPPGFEPGALAGGR